MTTKVVTASHPNHVFDLAITNAWDVTLAHANVGMVVENAPLGEQSDLYVVLRQDGVSGRVAHWPATVTWLSSAPQPTTPILVHLITLDGVNWYESPTQDVIPSGAVASVNGHTGVVELEASDVAAVPAAGGTVTGDITFSTDSEGPVLVDQSDGHTYRIISTAGVLSTVQVS